MKLVCEICGGKLIARANDIFECDSCGMQYDKTKIQEMVQEIKGTVKIEGEVKVEGTIKKEGLLQRVFMFLEDGEWDSANEYCEKVLDIEPENAEAYLGKLMASLRVKTRNGLSDLHHVFNTDGNYLKAIKFGDDSLKTELEGYINTINERNNLDNLNSIYIGAKQLFNDAKNDGKLYLKAKSKFDEIPDYKDSAELSAKCTSEYENWKQDIENKVEAIARAAETKKTGRQELSPDEKIEKLQKEKTTLETKKAGIPTAQKEYEELTEKKKNAELKITELAEKKKTLGAFKGKEKKAIDAETEKLQSDIRKLDNNLFTLKDKLNDSPEEIARKISSLQSEINQLETEKKNQRDNNYISLTFEEAKRLMQDSNIRELFMKKHSSLQYLFADTGDTVTLGRYNNGKGLNSITWKVLAKEGNRALLITKYGIDCKKYNNQQEKTSWEKCTLRKWLNNDFYNAAFSDSEKKMISVTNVTADRNPDYNTPQGNNTQDKVFLLSINEAKKYFASDVARQCAPTDYAVTNGAFKDKDNGNCWWWLRSSGITSLYAAFVSNVGSVDPIALGVGHGLSAVRPALWINLYS